MATLTPSRDQWFTRVASVLPPAHTDVLSAMLSAVGEAVAYCDANWVTQYCNDVYLANAGLTREQVIGHPAFEYFPGFKRSIFFEAFERCRTSQKPVTRIGFSTVLNRWLLVRVFPVQDGMLMLANDATESVVKQYQLAQKAVVDPLTGLGNKLAMEEHVGRLLLREEGFSVIVIGLERVGQVNHAHGYATGDMVLLEVASALQSASAPGETLFRVSGTEFAMVRQSPADEPALLRADALVDAVERPIAMQETSIVLAAHAGTAESPCDATEHEQLLKCAGLALHAARKSGRETSAAYRPEMETASRIRATLEAELRLAMDGQQFSLLVQPKVSLATGQVSGGEALIRWNHPLRGLLAPGAFLAVAQDMGMMTAIDQWVLRQALLTVAELSSHGLDMPISVNLSVDSLADMYLAQRVQIALDQAGVPARLLEIEIPEGALMRDVEVSARVLGQLHAMGVRLSIDDFGTGYSSFAYLAQFPVHVLKIDRSFVNGICTTDTSRKVVHGMVRLAHSLSLEVVAEGAEHEDQVLALQRMKCDLVQGYFFARPLSVAQFEAFTRRHKGRGAPDPASI